MNAQTFSETERLSKIALETGDLDRLEVLLAPWIGEDDRKRSAAENLFLYRTLGTMYKEKGESAEARTAFKQAHSYDARDLESLLYLAEAELSKEGSDSNDGILMDLLIYHRPELKSSQIMRIYKHFGDVKATRDDLKGARECYEKALEARPGEMDLINALLKVSEASGDEAAILKSRQKLLDSMTSAESRAAVMVTIGDDYLNRKNDEKSALSMYEQALAECASSTAANQRILTIAEKAEDWENCLNTLNNLIKFSNDPDEKCKFILKQAWIFKEKLNNTKYAIQLFNDVLDIQPNQFEVFKGIISILQQQDDFIAIEANYERMIKRHVALEPQNVKFLAMLYKSLGDLRLQKFNNVKRAIEAYKAVSDLYPDNVNFHIILAKLYAVSDETLNEAVHENREILRLAPDHLEAVSSLAKCYRRLERFDESLCTYRVLDVLGKNDEEGKQIVARFADTPVPKLAGVLSAEQWKRIIPKTLDMTLVKILRICTPYMSEKFINTLDKYGLKEKEARIDVSDNSIFANALRNSAKALGFAETPNIYRYEKLRGISNAYLEKRAFLVNSNLLKGRTEKEIAFATTKQLMLLRPEYYLIQLGLQAMEIIVKIIFKTIDPSANIQLPPSVEPVKKALEKGLTPVERDNVKKLLAEIVSRKSSLNINLFMESVEDFANRVALLFCDDPAVVNKQLMEEGRPISTRSAKARVGSLLVWALSEDFTALRAELGIALKA
ncbi:MAG: hypothetical protein IJU23_11710 [Proteobacteria bacterium]|nr:hypothetical protein [Pseudomonadota bacterium]